MPKKSVKARTERAESREESALVASLEEFLRKKYYAEMLKAANEGEPLAVDFELMDRFNPKLSEMLLNKPEKFFELCSRALEFVEAPGDIKVRFTGLPEVTNVRDLRSLNIGKFVCVEGTVKRASEVRPEIMEVVWECPDCGDEIPQVQRLGYIPKPFRCDCGNRTGFKQTKKKLVDMRRILIEEPFETMEGDKPSQLDIMLTEDLVSPKVRRMTDPGNRIKITGVLIGLPRGRHPARLEFYMEGNYVEPKEVTWERLEIAKKDEEEIKKVAKDPDVYRKLVASLAPSLYGLMEEKESIILQLFGGVPRTLKDGTKFRGDVHILFIGDPASGKSQLLKLVPEIVPRGKYVSGKGVTGAGLTATVMKDEQFMGGWVLEAGALVLTNKGLLAIDEFEKMNPDDQIAMHEALEQGTISIAKASIVATLPAQTSVLAGGNPKFSRFDPYRAISEQIDVPATLLSRFDLKFALRDMPDAKTDKSVVEHILRTREGDKDAEPVFDQHFIRKYIAYARDKIKPELTEEAGKMMKSFYVKTRKKAEASGASAIPITLRQFEALIRLSEASAKIRLSNKVEKQDTQRAIRLMMHSLRQLGFDPETREIDVDRSEGGVSSSERSKIRVILDIVNALSEKRKEVSKGEIEELAKREGIDDASEIVEKLKKEGMLFEPSAGYVQKV